MKKLLAVVLLSASSLVSAGSVSWGVSIHSHGFNGSVQSNHYSHRHQHRHYAQPVMYHAPNHYYQPHRVYVEPPRMPDPVYKSPSYYHYRNSCFPYPIHDQYGRVVSHYIRCM